MVVTDVMLAMTNGCSDGAVWSMWAVAGCALFNLIILYNMSAFSWCFYFSTGWSTLELQHLSSCLSPAQFRAPEEEYLFCVPTG